MQLRFTRDALSDLEELKAWLKPRAPDAHQRVVARLTAKIRILRLHPDIGRTINGSDIRVVVEARYGFVIPYRISGDTVWILRIYSARRYPLDYNTLLE